MDKKLSGKLVSDVLYEELKKYLQTKEEIIGLVDISVGDDFGGKKYAEMKKKTLESMLGYEVTSMHFDTISYNELLDEIKYINSNPNINGLMIQLPLPENLREHERDILDEISKDKDVDGLNSQTLGNLMVGNQKFPPCTPAGIIALLKAYEIPIEGKRVVIINRSNIVGKPLEQLFLQEDATVTLAHSKTTDLKELTKTADILVAALKKREYITADYIKDDSIIIDVGVHRNSEGKTVGDVDFDSVYDKCMLITPPTGGVGPMTICMLGYNVAKAKYGQEVDEVLEQGIEKAKVLVRSK